MKKLQVAIIGCGKHPVNFHIPAFKRLNSKFNVIGVYDKDTKRAQKIKEQFKIQKVYKSLDDLLRDQEVDIVDICSPATKHYRQIMKSMDNNIKNIIVEKPFVTKSTHMRNILKRNKVKKLNIICLCQQRFREESRSLKTFLNSNKKKLGKIFRIEGKAIYHDRIPMQIENSFTNRNLSGGGPLIDHGSHIMDLLFYLFPDLKIKKIHPFLFKNQNKKKVFYNVEDSAFINILLSNKIVFNFETSYVSPRPKEEFSLKLYYEKGYVIWPKMTCQYSKNKKIDKIKFDSNKLASDNQFLYIHEMITNNKNKNKDLDLASTLKVVSAINYCYRKSII